MESTALPLTALATLCLSIGCQQGPARGQLEPVEAPEPTAEERLGAELAAVVRLDAELGVYVGFETEQLTPWQAASKQLEERLRPLWRRTAEVAATGAASAPPEATEARGALVTSPPASRCAEGSCCAPSRPRPPPPRVGPGGVIRLEPICGLHGTVSRPRVLWSAVRAPVDLEAHGAALLEAMSAGDGSRARAEAGLLLAELQLRRAELTYARDGESDDRPGCGGAEGLLEELTTMPAVASEARYLRAVCLERQGSDDAAGVLARAAADGSLDGTWRLALHHRNEGELAESVALLDGLGSIATGPHVVTARTLAGLDAYRLDRFGHSVVELTAAAAELEGQGSAAMAEVITRFLVVDVIEWEEAVRHDGWPERLDGRPLIPLSERQGCTPLEVLDAHLEGSELHRRVIDDYGEIAFAYTLYHEAIEASRALARMEPLSDRQVRLRRRIRDAFVRLRQFDEALEEDRRIARDLGPGSAWWQAHLGDAESLAEARRLLEPSAAPPDPTGEPTTLGEGSLDPRGVLGVLDEHTLELTSCLWGPGRPQAEGPRWARADLHISSAGRIGGLTASSGHAAEDVAGCLRRRLEGLEVPPPEGGAATFELWLIAP